MTEEKRNIMIRIGFIYLTVVLCFAIVIWKIVDIQLEAEKWLKAIPNQAETTRIIKPTRGNIYSHDYRLMASSMPTYRISMDTRVPALHIKGGELFHKYIDSVSSALSSYFQDRSKSEYKRMITNAYNRGDGSLTLYPDRISYVQLKDIQKFPLFNLGRYRSGLIPEEQTQRVKPFGSLASRTIGGVYANEEKGGMSGLELYFNEYLKGEPGVCTIQKAASKRIPVVEKEPKAGADIITTIDVNLQDIAENALIKKLEETAAHSGYVILMEVRTGEIKAIVNMQKTSSGQYAELKNGIVSDMAEPGSTFKTASLMAAIDDGYINITDSIDVGNGRYFFYNAEMKDHNAHRGGYGKISIQNALEASSNVGISRVIVDAYGEKPSEFVKKLYKMGLNETLALEIPGTASPNIRMPNDKRNPWSGTTLPWMSIGYEVQIPPIYTLTFYNAIANNGKMIKPFFVKEIRQGNEVIESFETEVIRSSICSNRTLKQIKTALLGVVWSKHYATASAARSDKVTIAGKTGTAQISKGLLGYKGGHGKTHQISFCGYFPAEEPIFTALCVIREPRIGYPSGGTMCGSVVRNVAERTYALQKQQETGDITALEDFAYIQPQVKTGKYNKIRTATRKVGTSLSGERSEWSKIQRNDSIAPKAENLDVCEYQMPNVIGMGATDAVYAIERTGMRVHLEGKGRVVRQSIIAGTRATPGRLATLVLR